MTKLRPFTPIFYSANKEEDTWQIEIENLLFGRENASFIDIKLGTTTLTHGKSVVKEIVREHVDIERTTTFNFGFTICAMNLKDSMTGKPRDGGKFGKRK